MAIASQTFNASDTWQAPAGVFEVTVEATGGGGGGGDGNSTNQNTGRSGGGGGAFAKGIVTVTPGNIYTVTVGAVSGANGNPSSFYGDGAGSNGVLADAGTAGSDSNSTPVGTGGLAANSQGSVITRSGGDGGAGGGPGAGGGGGGGAASESVAGQSGAASSGVAGGGGGTTGAGGDGGTGGTFSTQAGLSEGSAPGGGGGGHGGRTTGSGAGGAGAAGRIVLFWNVPEPPTTLTATLQPTDGNLDSYIVNSSPTANGTGDTNLIVGERDDVANSAFRGLIRFDLSSIPNEAVIVSAVLTLTPIIDHSSNARTFRIFRLKRAWEAASVSWNNWKTGNAWSTAGAFGVDDCEQTDIGSRAFTATETLNVGKDFNLVAQYKSDLDLGNGWLIKADTENNDCYFFASINHATASFRPKLVVTYRIPARTRVSRGIGRGVLRGAR